MATVKSNKDDVDYIHAQLDLDGETCYLKHNKQHDPISDHPAIDYLVQYFGKTDDVIQEAQDELRIPICQDCIDGLSDPNWLLTYCTHCNNSQWIYRPLSHKILPTDQVVWTDTCPKCRR